MCSQIEHLCKHHRFESTNNSPFEMKDAQKANNRCSTECWVGEKISALSEKLELSYIVHLMLGERDERF